MSRLENLLTQADPLEAHEVSDLKEWLETLRGDVEDFGETPEDSKRMASIEAKIEQMSVRAK